MIGGTMDEEKNKADLDRAIEWAKNKINPTNPVTYSSDHGYWLGLSEAKKIMGPGSTVTDAPPS